MDVCKLFTVLAFWISIFLEINSEAIDIEDINYEINIHILQGFNKKKYYVWMDENNHSFSAPIALFRIIGMKDCSDLGILFFNGRSFAYELKDCIFYAAQSFDYENPNERSYLIQFLPVSIREEKVLVQLDIKNIDDESPSLAAPQCSFNENEVYTVFNSSCRFLLTDPDGYLERITLNVISQRDYEEYIFRLSLMPQESIPDTVKTANVTMYPVEALNFEAVSSYFFIVSAIDSSGNIGNRIASVQVIDGPD